MATQTPIAFKYKELQNFTDNFSGENYIGPTQFGHVYRGKIGEKAVTVKMWTGSELYQTYEDERKGKMNDEISLLEYESLKAHPNLVKAIGFCYESDENVGIVYDLSPLDTVRKLLPRDDFDWKKRIKVAIGLARALECVHMEVVQDPLMVRNLDANHVMCDEDYNPKLFEFGMISGGEFQDRTKPYRYPGCFGYADPCTFMTGYASTKSDVFAYGVILLGLISKRVFDPEEDEGNIDALVFEWAKKSYDELRKRMLGSTKISLVADSLKEGSLFFPSDGRKLTRLGLRCIIYEPEERPTMSQVLDTLLSLRVVMESSSFMGVEDRLCRVGEVTPGIRKTTDSSSFIGVEDRLCRAGKAMPGIRKTTESSFVRVEDRLCRAGEVMTGIRKNN